VKRRRASSDDLELYLLYRLRLRDLMNVNALLLQLDAVLAGFPPSDRRDCQGTLQTVYLGFLYSMVDTHRNALKVWPLWRRLFPQKTARINDVEAVMGPVMPQLEAFRHSVAFHVPSDLSKVLKAGTSLSPALGVAVVRFLELAQELIEEEGSVAGLRPYLKANGVRCT